ncbi:Ger(x)C family spore germination protein [Microaerobacter geothermalis]|uniref:Ger(x)C family spore germination protein n=1 Tax=Microaerobacter geothermalis TaxID=674972 RepID=UPI001F30D0ED|nr:Ger(x)C family spore germination protein [Microaerobacter geothermalis]MCF6094966.1 Ger(x)C family spore germination protein [Microaerobacter geothermalis]
MDRPIPNKRKTLIQKTLTILVIVVMMVSLGGCWNRRELDELAIASILGLEKSDGKYHVSVSIINAGQIAQKGGGAPGTRTPVTTYHAKADTLFEAFRKLTTEVPRKIYFSQLRMVVIGEHLAKDGIEKSLDMISRDHEFRTDFYIVVTNGTTPDDVIDVLTPIEVIPGNKMFSSLKMSQKSWAGTLNVTLDELISALTSDGREAVLTGVMVKGDEKEAQTRENVERIDSLGYIKYSGIAAFKKGKLVGWLNEDESIGYNQIQGKVKSTIVNVPCPKGKTAIEIIRTKATIKGRVENGRPKITIDYWAEGNIGEVECPLDLTKTKTLYDQEIKTEQVIKENMEKALRKAQKTLKADIFGFGEAIHRSNPKAWKDLKKNWDKEFADIKVEFKVDVKLRRTGTINNPFFKK